MKTRTNGFSTIHLIAGLVLFASAAAILAVLFMDTRGEKGSGLGKEFEYDLGDLRKIDPALFLYREEGGAIPTGFAEASALAVGPNDEIYVAGDQAVRTFSPAGEKRPLEDGAVYVGVGDHVERYTKDGRLERKFGPGSFITSIAVIGRGVFAADFGKREVHQFDASGEHLGSFGDFVIPSPYFDLALSKEGMLHVTNTGEHRIEAYAKSGDLMSWWGRFSNTDIEGFSGCCNPVNIALLPDGGFVTCEKGLTRVKVYDREGAFKGVVAGPEQFARHDSLCAAPDYDLTRVGLDVAVDSKGRVLVLDPALSEVRIFKRGEKE